MREVFLLDGARTPFLRVDKTPNPLDAINLALSACKPLLLRQTINTTLLDEVIVGITNMGSPNIAHQLALRVGSVANGFVVHRDGGSGLQAIASAQQSIVSDKARFVLAGGVESFSNVLPTLDVDTINWLRNWQTLTKCRDKLKALKKINLTKIAKNLFACKALIDPLTNLTMAQTAEEIAYKYGISRQEADNYTLGSQHKALQAYKNNVFVNEIVDLYDYLGNVINMDNVLQHEIHIEELNVSAAITDVNFSNVTVANSACMSDGAAFVLVGSDSLVKEHSLTPLAKIVDYCWESVEPKFMGLGPVYAIAKLLKNNKLKFSDISYWEISEIFAHQILGCLNAMQDVKFCQEHFNMQLGAINPERLNVDGGSLAIGYPVGADGARLVLHLANNLRLKKARYGIASVCVEGGQGGAMLLENIAGEII